MDQDAPKLYNREFNDALKWEWETKIQKSSGLTLFDEAREKIQSIKKTSEGTKPVKIIYDLGNDFCRGLFGTCDKTSLYSRLVQWCESARNKAMEKMDSQFIKNNTKLLKDSYTSCYDLANDVMRANKKTASLEAAWWKKKQIETSRENYSEKIQNNFQEKVSDIWDVFKKKMVNFVRSIEGITRNVYR